MPTQRRFRIRKGDTVEVVAGRDRGRRGSVERVVPSTGRVVVEGINLRKRHRRARAVGQRAGIIEFNAPLDISNLVLVCPQCGERTRVRYQFDADGAKQRRCHKCDEPLGES